MQFTSYELICKGSWKSAYAV